MEAAKKIDDHVTSAAAFVEGGVQEACDDACSICLEDFSHSDPSTVTNCKHEFHLQCILEWCQRSSNCPMCWQLISLKDATSQQLLEAVVKERRLTSNRSRNATIHHPSLEDFELQHALQLPIGTSEIELEEHIFRHLAAAAMRRGHHSFRREGQRNQASSQGHQPFFIFSGRDAPQSNAVSTSTNPDRRNESASVYRHNVSRSRSNGAHTRVSRVSFTQPETDHDSSHRIGSDLTSADRQTILSEAGNFSRQPFVRSQDPGEPSDLQSFSESLKSRLNAWSMRYKESLSRNTRGWKERLFARNPSIADVGTEVQSSVSRIMGRLNIRDDDGPGHSSGSSSSSSVSNTNNPETYGTQMRESPISPSCATGSASN